MKYNLIIKLNAKMFLKSIRNIKNIDDVSTLL